MFFIKEPTGGGSVRCRAPKRKGKKNMKLFQKKRKEKEIKVETSLEGVCLQWGAKEVDAMSVYQDMFWLGDNLIQRSNEKNNLKANPLGYFRNKGEEKVITVSCLRIPSRKRSKSFRNPILLF